MFVQINVVYLIVGFFSLLVFSELIFTFFCCATFFVGIKRPGTQRYWIVEKVTNDHNSCYAFYFCVKTMKGQGDKVINTQMFSCHELLIFLLIQLLTCHVCISLFMVSKVSFNWFQCQMMLWTLKYPFTFIELYETSVEFTSLS